MHVRHIDDRGIRACLPLNHNRLETVFITSSIIKNGLILGFMGVMKGERGRGYYRKKSDRLRIEVLV